MEVPKRERNLRDRQGRLPPIRRLRAPHPARRTRPTEQRPRRYQCCTDQSQQSVGFASEVLSDSTTTSTPNIYFRLHRRGGEGDRAEPSQTPATGKGTRFLAIMSDTPMDVLFAQDIFSTFMWAIANKKDQLDGDTTVHPSNADWRSFRTRRINSMATQPSILAMQTGDLSELRTRFYRGWREMLRE